MFCFILTIANESGRLAWEKNCRGTLLNKKQTNYYLNAYATTIAMRVPDQKVKYIFKKKKDISAFFV